MDKILEKLNKMEAELAEYKKYTESVILVNTALIQEIATSIDVKLDILCNLDNANASTNNIIIDGNSKNIQGSSSNYNISTNRTGTEFIFLTGNGWILTNN